jgi:hypothetical protein
MRIRPLLLLFALPLLAGCKGDLFVPDFNNPTLDCTSGLCELPADPSRSQLAAAATGILIASRLDYGDYIRDVGILGREAYDLDGSDPRFVSEMLQAVFDPGSRAFGGDHWLEQYEAIRTGYILLNALDAATSITDAEKEALRGFAQTFEAWNLLLIINTHDTNGAVIDLNQPVGFLAPIESKDVVFQRISDLLDEAQGHLQAGGSAFPFDLTSGFAGFDTPTTFLTFNRALKARVEVYRGNFASALSALGQSFIVDCGSFNTGPAFTHSTSAGDIVNGIFEDPATADIRAHPSLPDLAQLQANGSPDLRAQSKLFRTDPKTLQDHTSDLTFLVYSGPGSPIPIIRNEELILLRAEANIGLGNVGAAATDINCIRTQVGGLAARADLSAANALDELLYNKLFSLLFEGGHRWVDMRRYGKLGELPIDIPGLDVVHDVYPIPRDEVLPR